MKKLTLILSIVILGSLTVAAQVSSQTNANGSANSSTGVTKEGKMLKLDSASQVAAELQSSLNVEKAKVGDQVLLKTKQAIRQNGEVVVKKGATLVGRVTEVQKKTKDSAESRIGILFDTLKQGNLTMPITATIVSVTNVAARASYDDGYADAGAMTGSNTSATVGRSGGSGGSGGGLLGGVGQTVGGVVNTTTRTVGGVGQTVGSVADTTVGTATNTTAGLTSNVGLGSIRISQSADASANSSSTLSLSGGNLKLDKGAMFTLNISSNASVSKDNQ